ncbi:MAG: hypothetical protein N2544_10415 [Burkholderiales bacterium]|nr:hypothetical protein [Burkholderiales bacterium]
MAAPGLRYDQAPPFAVPLRFFLTAPLFLVAAALVVGFRGEELFASRFSPAALAATHLVTLGFMAMTMLGAMSQVLPVLAGVPLPRPRLVAALAHAGITAGTAALAGGFLWGAPGPLKAGVLLLGGGLGVFLAAVAIGLARAPNRAATGVGLALAALGLAVTVALGLELGAVRAWGRAAANLAARDLHPAWGLFGWTGLLVAVVGFHVVPMFQMTPPYPATMQRWLAPAVFALLVAWSAARWGGDLPRASVWLLGAVAGGWFAFAVTTIALQARRRRPRADATLLLWRLGMACAVAALAGWAASVALATDAIDVAVGVLALVGFAVSVIAGMLHKIVPFLAWFHLRALVPPGRRVPHMGLLLPDPAQRRYVVAQAAAVAAMLAAVAAPPWMAPVAAAALALAALLLEWNLVTVLRAFRRARDAA